MKKIDYEDAYFWMIGGLFFLLACIFILSILLTYPTLVLSIITTFSAFFGLPWIIMKVWNFIVDWRKM